MEDILQDLKLVLQYELEVERKKKMKMTPQEKLDFRMEKLNVAVRKDSVLKRLSPYIKTYHFACDFCRILRKEDGSLQVFKKKNGLNAI